MRVPDWWSALLLGGAAFRVYRLLAKDVILDGPRAWVLRLPRNWEEGDKIPEGFREKWSTFMVCPWCLGFWICVGWWVAWQIWSHGTPARVDWKTRRFPSDEKYASAFSPPRVSWRRFVRCFSAWSGGSLDAGEARKSSVPRIAATSTELDMEGCVCA